MDTIFDTIEGVEITPHVQKTQRKSELPQLINVTLSGFAHIQTVGEFIHELEVDFVLHTDNDAALLRAWKLGHLLKVVNDGATRYGYITSLELEEDMVEGYHKGNATLQEDLIL